MICDSIDLQSYASNQALFGHNPRKSILAVDHKAPGIITLFSRNTLGGVETESFPFRPFFWTDSEFHNAQTLAGNHPLRFIGHVDSFDDLKSAKRDSTNGDHVFFALNDPVQQFLTESGITLFKGMHFSDLRRMQLAIKTGYNEDDGLAHSERHPIITIALADSTGWETCLMVPEGSGDEGERQLLEECTRIIQERDPDIIEGHSLFKFDLPYLHARARRLKTKLAWGRDGSAFTLRSSRLQIAEKLIEYQRPALCGRHFVDTWVLTQLYDVGARELESYDLQSVAKHFNLHEPNRVHLEGEQIARAYQREPNQLKINALHDVRETQRLAALLSQSYFIQAQIFPFNYQDIILRGNATKINGLFIRSYLEKQHSLPLPPSSQAFEGGYTDIMLTGVIHNVWHGDIASLYPSIILQFQIDPASDSLGLFRQLLNDLRHLRLDAKSRARTETAQSARIHFEALQNTLKILINSFYGYLGFAQGNFADYDAAARVTAHGRQLLGFMVEWLNSEGATVIEIDTDGIYFHPPPNTTPPELEARLQAQLPPNIDIEIDKIYCAMFSYKAKNYALLDNEGEMRIKGSALKSRGLEKYLRQYLEELIRALLSGDKVRAKTLEHDYAQAILHHQWPIEMLAKIETLQDSVASYQKKIAASTRNRSAAFELAVNSGRNYYAGDQIAFYITGTKRRVTAFEHAKLITDWHPKDRDENVSYYIGKLRDLAQKFEEFISDDK